MKLLIEKIAMATCIAAVVVTLSATNVSAGFEEPCKDTGCAANGYCSGGATTLGCIIMSSGNCKCDSDPTGPGCFCKFS
jgi:hypothetical protein